MSDQPGRRHFIGAAALAGAALLTGGAADLPTPETPPDLWSASYWATKHRDGEAIRLAVYRKRAAEPKPGAAALPVLLLVHGSSPAALASFDLTVSGHADFSLMNVFARLGYDVWTLDFEGYGRSSQTSGNSDIASGVQDLIVVTDLIRAETGQARQHLLGESSGAIRAAAFAQAQPDRAGRLVLAAFTYTGAGSPTLTKRAEQTEFYRTHNRRPRDRAMLESIFTRDHPGTTDPDVARAFVEKEIVNGDSDRDLSRHDGASTDRRPGQSAQPRPSRQRRVRRHLDARRPAGFLRQAAERRPSAIDHQGCGAFGDRQSRAPGVSARGAGVPDDPGSSRQRLRWLTRLSIID